VAISSIIDALVVLRQDWPVETTHQRQMLVVKVRGTRHANTWNPFRITDTGLEFGDGVRRPDGAQGSAGP
jgi:KaiC/GvpD/RAD55 family RecA-like ATPase